MIDDAIAELAPILGSKRGACRATGRPQANHYRRHRQSPVPPRPVRERRPQPRALSQTERDTVRTLLNSPDFVDKAPATVYHELLDEGVYLDDVPDPARAWRGQGTPPPGHPSGPGQTRTCCYETKSVLVMGYHQAARPGQVVPTSTCT